MHSIILQTKTGFQKISLAKIYYFQTHASKSHCVQAITENGIIDLSQTLQQLQETLGDQFVRSHRGYLVNLDQIQSIQVHGRLLYLGEKEQYRVPYSRYRYAEIRQKWLKKGE